MQSGWRRLDTSAMVSCIRICRRASRSAVLAAKTEPCKPAEAHVVTGSHTSRALQTAREHNIPVEKYSLSRGLALNRFEKDFFIFPEYTDTDSLTNIKLFTSALQQDLQSSSKESNGTAEERIASLMQRHKIASLYVPTDFGGLGMCNKDLLAVSEVLGEDWCLFETANQRHLAANIILLYGNDDQKDRLLPKIASGELRPAICISEENMGLDFLSMKTECISVENSVEKVSGKKENVIGASSANLLFLFAKRKSFSLGSSSVVCYVIETERYPKENFRTSRVGTLGLNALDVGCIEVKDLSVRPEDLLAVGSDVASEVCAVKKVTYGAAATGFMRMLVGKLANFCNSVVRHNARLSENRSIQRSMTDLTLNTFVLESMTYYIGGVLDENLVVVTDIESAIIHKFANRALREAVAITAEIIGAKSCESGLEFEKFFRDVTTVLSLGNTDMNLAEIISTTTLTSWANANAASIAGVRRFKTGFFSRMFGLSGVNLNNPKLVIFLAEHAHPSLEKACRDLEISMSRINLTVGKVLEERGKGVDTDFAALCSIAKVVENNFAMLACISRATRSYSIGLRNSDLEVAWTTIFCSNAAQSTFNELKALSDYFGLVRVNPALLEIGCTVFDNGGYCIETPVEKNW